MEITTRLDEHPAAYFVPIAADRMLPGRYIATADAPGLPLVHVTVAVVDGRPEAEALRIERRADGPPITSTTLREIPLGTIVRESVAKAGVVEFRWISRDDPRAAGGPDFEEGSPELAAVVQDHLRNAYDARQGVPVTDEVLRRVADIYRQAHAAGKPPTEAVKRELVVSRSTAGRYVQRARERGFLGRTRQRVAGEHS